MFIVFSKDKILAYLVSIGTVAILFVMSFAITNNNDAVIRTSANQYNENSSIETNANQYNENSNTKTSVN